MVHLGVKQMLYRKNNQSVLTFHSGSRINALSQELLVSVNGFKAPKMLHHKKYHLVLMV